MIKELKRNEIYFALPYVFRKQNESLDYSALALKIVNSEKRVFEINGFMVISQSIKDLNYIHDLFSNVRIKHFFINSVKLYHIDYASNFDLFYKNQYITEFEKNKYFMDFEMLLSGFKTIDDVKQAQKYYNDKMNLKVKRLNSKKTVDVIKENRKKIATNLLNQKISSYQTIKNVDGKTYYIVNDTLFSYYDLTHVKHHGLYYAFVSGRLQVRG